MTKLNLKDFYSDNPKVKYAAAKKAVAISKENPAELYADFDFFVNLLDNENQIIKWTAIQIIGNLSKTDKEKKVDELLPRLIDFLNCGKLITANHAIFALAEIALNKPEHQEQVIKELLKVERYNYDTVECRNIALGKVILALEKFREKIKDDKEIIEFLKRQTKNSRIATSKKAQQLLKKISR